MPCYDKYEYVGTGGYVHPLQRHVRTSARHDMRGTTHGKWWLTVTLSCHDTLDLELSHLLPGASQHPLEHLVSVTAELRRGAADVVHGVGESHRWCELDEREGMNKFLLCDCVFPPHLFYGA